MIDFIHLKDKEKESVVPAFALVGDLSGLWHLTTDIYQDNQGQRHRADPALWPVPSDKFSYALRIPNWSQKHLGKSMIKIKFLTM